MESYQLSAYRDGIHTQLSTLTGHINQTQDMETLQEVKSLVTAALNIMKAREKAVLPAAKQEPANKCITTQRPFFSTKRKRSRASVRLAKPTTQEKVDICKALLNGPINAALTPLKQSIFSEFLNHTQQVLTSQICALY